jgi:hypothetical protein
MPIMSPEKFRELKEKRKALQSELKEIDRSGVPERRINDQGKEVTFMPIGFENLRRWSAIKLKLERLDEQLKQNHREAP